MGAPDGESNALAGTAAADLAPQISGGPNRASVHGHDDVGGKELPGRRLARVDDFDQGAAAADRDSIAECTQRDRSGQLL